MTDPETDRLVRDLEACAIPAGTLHHEQHVRVAWAMLGSDGIEATLRRLPEALRRYAEHVGAHGLYHETVTWAFLFLIHERRRQLPADHGWEDFAQANPDLLRHKQTLARYYTKERIESELARTVFLMPDLGPLGALPEEAKP